MTHIGLTVPLNFVLAPLPLDNFQNGDKQHEQCKVSCSNRASSLFYADIMHRGLIHLIAAVVESAV